MQDKMNWITSLGYQIIKLDNKFKVVHTGLVCVDVEPCDTPEESLKKLLSILESADE